MNRDRLHDYMEKPYRMEIIADACIYCQKTMRCIPDIGNKRFGRTENLPDIFLN